MRLWYQSTKAISSGLELGVGVRVVTGDEIRQEAG